MDDIMIELGKVSPRSAVSMLFFSWFIALFFFAAITLLFMGKYAQKEEVSGHVITRNIIRLNSERTGHVEKVLVAVGEKVKKNQPLVRIRNIEPNILSEHGDMTATSQSAERIRKLLEETEYDKKQIQSTYENQKKLINLQRDQLTKDIALNLKISETIERRLKIAEENKNQYEYLVKQRATAKISLQDAIMRYESVIQEQANNEVNLTNSKQRLLELEQRENEAKYSNSKSQSEILRQQHELKENLEALNRSEEYILLSPAAGIVDAISVFSGGQINRLYPLMLIRANDMDDKPTVLLDVSSSSIGFADEGTEVILRFNSFPYESYGVVKGKIIRNSASTLLAPEMGNTNKEKIEQQTYLVEVALDFDQKITKIRPDWLKDGMTVKGSLKLKELTLFEWLFLPVVKGIKRNPDYFSTYNNDAVVRGNSL